MKVMLEERPRCRAPWEAARCQLARHHVAPQRLAKRALKPYAALVLALRALGAVPQEEQPLLLSK